jgi:hypothetical protein
MNTQHIRTTIKATSNDRDTFLALVTLLEEWEPNIVDHFGKIAAKFREQDNQIIELKNALATHRGEIKRLQELVKQLTGKD